MSITKICTGANWSTARLRGLHAYLVDDVKTDNQRLTGGHAGGRSIEAMEIVKRLYHKQNGRQFIHAVILPTVTGYIEPQKYLDLAELIAQIFPDYQSTYAVHTDTKHLHLHILFNSVNYKTGRKFSMSKSDLNGFRQKVNLLLDQFGFEPIIESANLIWQEAAVHEVIHFSRLEIDEALLPPIQKLSGIDIWEDQVQIETITNPDYPTGYSQFGRYFDSPNENYVVPRRKMTMESQNQFVPTLRTPAASMAVQQPDVLADTPTSCAPTLSLDMGTHLEINVTPDTDLTNLAPVLENIYQRSGAILDAAVNAGYALCRKANEQNLPVNIHIDAAPHLQLNLGTPDIAAVVDTSLADDQ